MDRSKYDDANSTAKHSCCSTVPTNDNDDYVVVKRRSKYEDDGCFSTVSTNDDSTIPTNDDDDSVLNRLNYDDANFTRANDFWCPILTATTRTTTRRTRRPGAARARRNPLAR